MTTADIGNNSSVDVTYKWDALGRRVYRDDGTSAYVYIQVGQQTIADYGWGMAPASPKYNYVYASYIDEPVMREEPSANERLFFHRSQQFSVVALTTSSGAIVERYAYSAYGAPTVCNASGTDIGSSAKDNRVTYTGREWDDELVLYHFRARLFDANNGRMFSRDRFNFLGSPWNLYQFLSNKPLATLDPSGNFEVPESRVSKVKACLLARLKVPRWWDDQAAEHKANCWMSALRMALTGDLVLSLGEVGIGIMLAPLGPLMGGLRGILTQAVLQEAMEAVLRNQSFSKEEKIQLVIDIPEEAIGSRADPAVTRGLREIAEKMVESVEELGAEYGCRLVTANGEGASCSASCTFFVCTDPTGNYSLPSITCNYSCKRGKAQNCLCVEGDASWTAGPITGSFDPDSFFTSCRKYFTVIGVK